MSLNKVIYLDNNATTPVDPEVLEAMLPYFKESFANAASFSHEPGRKVFAAVEEAREKIAKVIGAEGKDIIFTSGATESINLAIKGVAKFYQEKGKHIITSMIEHKAVLGSCEELAEMGFRVDYLNVDKKGLIDFDKLQKLIGSETILVSLQHANNEIGTVQDIYKIGELCRSHGVLFHLDAAQSFGKLPIDVDKMKIDLLAISGHKIYGPKGIGALYVRRKNPRVRLKSQMQGGLQEREMRAGTLNVPGIIGLGKAAEIASKNMGNEQEKLRLMTDYIMSELKNNLERVSFNGGLGQELPGNLSVSVGGIDARELLCGLPKLAMSTGSACTSALMEPSHVLRAVGVKGELAEGTFRIGMGRMTTMAEVEFATKWIILKIKELQKR